MSLSRKVGEFAADTAVYYASNQLLKKYNIIRSEEQSLSVQMGNYLIVDGTWKFIFEDKLSTTLVLVGDKDVDININSFIYKSLGMSIANLITGNMSIIDTLINISLSTSIEGLAIRPLLGNN